MLIINRKNILNLFEKPYTLLNIYFAFIIISIFIYAVLFAGKDAGLHCQYKAIYGKECPGCGLTRGFKSVLSGNFSQALLANSGSLWIFGFFAWQLLLRFSAIYTTSKKWFREEILVYTDAVLSTVLLIVCFGKGYGWF